MKKVMEFSNIYEANMAKELLEKNNINALVKADDVGGTRPALAFTSGVELLIDENDFEKAEELLRAFFKNPNPRNL